MKTEQNQLDLFPEDLPKESPIDPPTPEKPTILPPSRETAPVRTELRAIHCSRCGEWLCDALAGARSYCPRCRVWSGNGEPV
ncbi:MAG: hypothetical protein ACC613_07615 [Synergistales bacterium]|jgi:hypothetical protein